MPLFLVAQPACGSTDAAPVATGGIPALGWLLKNHNSVALADTFINSEGETYEYAIVAWIYQVRLSSRSEVLAFSFPGLRGEIAGRFAPPNLEQELRRLVTPIPVARGSVLGATRLTRWPHIFKARCRAWMPGAWWPSSLVNNICSGLCLPMGSILPLIACHLACHKS